MASSKNIDFEQSKQMGFSVRKAMAWFKTRPYHHIAVFSKRKGEYYENIDPNDPTFFTRLKDNVEDGSQRFNYSVRNAISAIRRGTKGRFLIYSKRNGKYYVNKRDDSDGFAELKFLKPSPDTYFDAEEGAAQDNSGGGETKGPAAPAGATKAAAAPVIETDPCKLPSIDVATCPIKDLDPHTHPCLPKRNVLLFHSDKNIGCEECVKEKGGIWMNRCQKGTGGQGGGRRKTKRRRKRKRRHKRRKRKTKKRRRKRRRRTRKL